MTLPGDSGDSAQECCLEGENALSFTVGGLPQSCRHSAAVPRQPLEHHLEGIVKIHLPVVFYFTTVRTLISVPLVRTLIPLVRTLMFPVSVHQKWRLYTTGRSSSQNLSSRILRRVHHCLSIIGPRGGAPSPRESEIQSIFKQRQAIVTLSACGGSVASDLRRRFERRKYFDNAVTNILAGKKTQ